MIKRRTRNNKISVNGMLIANPFTAASGLLASADEVVSAKQLTVINLIIMNSIIGLSACGCNKCYCSTTLLSLCCSLCA